MSKRKRRIESHDFYCLKCGRENIPIFRNVGFKRERFHRKRLYCPFCKEEVNHLEIRSFDHNKEELLERLKNGEFYEPEVKDNE